MQTHTKEVASTVAAFVVIVSVVHAGIWFKLFGIPDITVLNWPFHYFWFVVGALVSLLVVFWVYHWYATRLAAEKAELHERHERTTANESPTSGGGGSGTGTGSGED